MSMTEANRKEPDTRADDMVLDAMDELDDPADWPDETGA